MSSGEPHLALAYHILVVHLPEPGLQEYVLESKWLLRYRLYSLKALCLSDKLGILGYCTLSPYSTIKAGV